MSPGRVSCSVLREIEREEIIFGGVLAFLRRDQNMESVWMQRRAYVVDNLDRVVVYRKLNILRDLASAPMPLSTLMRKKYPDHVVCMIERHECR